MEEIDWDKAPEGATHFVKACTGFNWHRHDTSGDFYTNGNGVWHPSDFGASDWEATYGPNLFIARPINKVWNGEGCPPVGTICEYTLGISLIWYECEVKYHLAGYGIKEMGEWAVVIHCPHLGYDQVFEELDGRIKFRPIKTPEQITAEERKAALDEMVYGACGCEPDGGNTSAFIVCGLLYDAGYRKINKDQN